MEELERNTGMARGQYGYSHLLKMTESHLDSTVRYAGEIFSARFSTEELAQLLMRRLEAEDAQWQTAYSAFGFLAKMAPYFGMMATVIGMVKLLENMSDFSGISTNMALAMQGTLYGLVSFLLIYSPMQRFFQEVRIQIMKRNEMVVKWFILISEQADPTFIQKELRSTYLTDGSKRTEVRAQSTSSARSIS
jgi:flagellar motor component MotA